MARKSRKAYRVNAEQEAVVEEKATKVQVAVYCRLSRADVDTGKDSMVSQLEIIRSYVAEHSDMEIVDEFLDDGYTGTNYKRPQFELMMEGIREGKYQCLIVKDLSRLGRNYIETSDLIEMELPLHGCRFISINDHIDTATSPIDTILVGLKNLMNQKFAEDISKKIKGQFRDRAKNGETLGGKPPYGYVRRADNVGYLEIDEEAAAVVRRIYQLKLERMQDTQIARVLTAEGIYAPSDYAYWKKTGEMPETRKPWARDTVKTILISPTYMGHCVHGKCNEKAYLGQVKGIHAKRSNWWTVEDVNPPIITKEVFEEVQKIRFEMGGRYGCKRK